MKKKKIIITVMEPIVENVSSKNVASKEGKTGSEISINLKQEKL